MPISSNPLSFVNIHSDTGSLNANIVDVHARLIYHAELVWRAGRIVALHELGSESDGLPYLLPGFIDAHVHIESSMLPPYEFARLAVRHGTVATVSDPHEIANVLGVAGVDYMLNNARHTPFKFCFGAPSCVPATSFETAGARLDSEQVQTLLQNPDIHYLSEVMNYPGVLAEEPEMQAKLAAAKHLNKPIDGHAPGVMGDDLQRYVEAGISSDHECTTLEEAEAKLTQGMAILIREGSAARNFDTLHPLISRHPEKVMFCSDDKHPDELQAGHIDRLVARAVADGYGLFDVLQCACINPIRHYDLPVGQLRVGDSMDAVLVSDLDAFKVLKTWIGGRLLACEGNSLLPPFSPAPINIFHAEKLKPEDFTISSKPARIRVIQAFDGQLLTGCQWLEPKTDDGKLVADVERDILWLVVVNRYEAAPPAIAMIQGFGLRHGALASSVAHDSHNVIGVGSDVTRVCRAVNTVIEHKGGIACAIADGVECLPLPIAGLMSDADGDDVAERYAVLDKLAKDLGSPLRAPFMTLSFMALLVIPQLKLSDRGLFDGQRFAFTSLWEDA